MAALLHAGVIADDIQVKPGVAVVSLNDPQLHFVVAALLLVGSGGAEVRFRSPLNHPHAPPFHQFFTKEAEIINVYDFAVREKVTVRKRQNTVAALLGGL